jgi:hypothetical protein
MTPGVANGKNVLVKDDITRDVNTPRGAIQALVAFMHRTIPEKNTHFRAEL